MDLSTSEILTALRSCVHDLRKVSDDLLWSVDWPRAHNEADRMADIVGVARRHHVAINATVAIALQEAQHLLERVRCLTLTGDDRIEEPDGIGPVVRSMVLVARYRLQEAVWAIEDQVDDQSLAARL